MDGRENDLYALMRICVDVVMLIATKVTRSSIYATAVRLALLVFTLLGLTVER